MTLIVPNAVSNARDFCMLERNLLSHLKLALLLSLLSSSLLLRVRLVPDPDGPPSHENPNSSLPLAVVEVAAALAAILGGAWEYQSGCQDVGEMRPFLVAAK